MMPVRSTQQGYTLVEVMVYITIFVFISVGAIGLLFSLQELFSQYQVRQSLFVAGTTSMERMLLEVRESDAVQTDDSVFGSDVSVLTLEQAGEIKNFAVQDNQLIYTSSDGSVTSLHSPTVTVTEYQVFHYEVNRKSLVRIRLTLQAAHGDYAETYTLQSGVIVRGTYGNHE